MHIDIENLDIVDVWTFSSAAMQKTCKTAEMQTYMAQARNPPTPHVMVIGLVWMDG